MTDNEIRIKIQQDILIVVDEYSNLHWANQPEIVVDTEMCNLMLDIHQSFEAKPEITYSGMHQYIDSKLSNKLGGSAITRNKELNRLKRLLKEYKVQND